jgi:hypothetical protein
MIDIEKIEALAEAAPRGEWEIRTSNSWRRVYAGGVPAITPCVHRFDNHPDLSFGDGVREWLEGVTPDVVAELVAEMRKLRAELEAREADRQRLDSGCIMTHEWNEFGEEYQCERRGLDLRARIDAALAQRQEGEEK